MVQKYLVCQNCKDEVFGLGKIADDFDYSILHYLMEKKNVRNNDVDFWYGIGLYYFYLVEKMGNFLFVFVRIVVDHENSLSLKSVVVYFFFVRGRIFEYLF